MISINTVRNTILYLIEKNNRGYIKPDAFDSFCQLAQYSIFEDTFYQYNNWLNKESRRLSNSEFADLPKNLKEQIDIFSMYSNQTNFSLNVITGLWEYSGSDLYRAVNLSLVNNFNGNKTEIEEVNSGVELTRILKSSATKPTLVFPVAERIGSNFKIYPQDITGNFVELYYIRKPKQPKWTYVNSNGNPLYNASDPLLQDIELHPSCFEKLIVKIMGYVGISIREADVVQASSGEDAKITSKEQ
jgi:hypothetical protein